MSTERLRKLLRKEVGKEASQRERERAHKHKRKREKDGKPKKVRTRRSGCCGAR
jgi:hypothetical protein